MKRPMTQKEIREKKSRGAADKDTITIQNISKQLITIHARPKEKKDFYISAQDVHLRPGKMVTLPKSRLWESQITRLGSRKMISVIRDSAREHKVKEEAEAKKILNKNNEDPMVIIDER